MSHADFEFERPPLDPYNQVIAKTRQRHSLFGVHCKLTYRCNARNARCFLDVLPPNFNSHDELNTAEYVRVVDELAALGELHFLQRRDIHSPRFLCDCGTRAREAIFAAAVH